MPIASSIAAAASAVVSLLCMCIADPNQLVVGFGPNAFGCACQNSISSEAPV
jgi:hypothetical protein